MGTPAVATPVPPTGLHIGVPYAIYDQWPAARHSRLRLFNRTPAHARHAIENPPEPAPWLELGRAIHVAVLEPERFAREYVGAPKVNRSTTIGKGRWSDFVAANVGKRVLDADVYAVCRDASASVMAHSTARQIIEAPGLTEVSALWRDAETGLLCKSRPDRLTALSGWSVVGDLKSGRDASSRAFEREIYKFGYAQQAAMYLDGCDALTPAEDRRERKFIFIVVETEPPYCVAVYDLDPEAIALGRDEYRAHLAQYARCMKTGVWSGYDQGIGNISLPPWAFKFHGEEA
jgi:exodeoxyribonuclease VIII